MMDDDDCGDIIYSVYIYIYPIQVTKYNAERNGEGKPQVPTRFDISNHIYIFIKLVPYMDI